MKKIRRITFSKKQYGGNYYESSIDNAFIGAQGVDYKVVSSPFSFSGVLKALEIPLKIWKFSSLGADSRIVKINSFICLPLMPFARNTVTIVHHVDYSQSPRLSRLYQKLAEFVLKYIYSRSNTIVVEAKCWYELIQSYGYKKVELFYNPFKIEDYEGITEPMVENFLKEKGLRRGGYFYIGNPQAGKGYFDVVRVLGSRPETLVVTGEGQPTEQTRHFHLGFRDYLCLLKGAKATVTMSKFKEGWCRVAHESVLCGTPVVGSGLGGMGELLEITGQEVCTEVDKLPEVLDRLPTRVSDEALAAAKQFNLEGFHQQWRQVLL